MKKYNIFIFLVVTICFFSNNVLASKVRPSWLTISDERFATEYRNLAFSNNIEDQSEFAWMLFARLNQPISKDISYRVWELWPDNSTTFSLKAKKIENSEKFKKERNGPALQTIKAHLESFIISSPKVGEEVTRNFLSYNYIINNQLNSRAGIKRKFEKTDYQVDFPVGAIEIKADWEEYEDVPRNKLSYYIKDKAGRSFLWWGCIL